MARLQAKNKEQQEFVRSKLTDTYSAIWVGTINEDRLELDGWVDFDQMAELVDYLRCQGKHEIAMCEECARLFDENKKLFNICVGLTNENADLKEKCKNLPRIATLNKRIHELKEQIKKYERE